MNCKKDTVVYQIYPRSFADSDADGYGDLVGIISRLPYIKELGANAIWLSPIYLSPDHDNGYDVADYKMIHPRFGTMDDFDRLVKEARALGIDIIMDLIINHTSDEHEWFRRAMKGEEKYRNYYIIKEGKDGKVPNNWGNFFAECPWTKLPESENEYYFHLFSKKQPDLNWENPDVLDEIEGIMRFWLDRGVRGFRCDVINVIGKESFNDGKKKLILTGSENYLSKESCHDILRKLRTDVLEPYGAWAVGETVFVGTDDAHAFTADTRGELDMVFSFEHMECDQRAVKWFKKRLNKKQLMRTLTRWQTSLDWNALYFENHDQPRFISRLPGAEKYRAEASCMVAGLLMSLRGTPFVYQGQELGMTNGDFSSMDEIEDIESHNVYAFAKKLLLSRRARFNMIKKSSRDNARTPMQWSGEVGAGFTQGEPWLKINKNHSWINVEWEKARDGGVLDFWQKMIAKRKSVGALREGSFKVISENGSIYAYERAHEGTRYLCICNMTPKALTLPKKLVGGKLDLSSYKKPQIAKLMPFEFRLVRLSDGTAAEK